MSWGDNTKGPWGQTPNGKSGGKKPEAGNKPSTGGRKPSASKNEKIVDIDQFFKKRTGGGGKGGRPVGDITIKAILALFIVVLIGWSITGFYEVDASEEAVVLRFGEYHRTETEGLRWHIPLPIEKVYIIPKTKINSVQIGYRVGSDKKIFKESLMITGDTNIADVTFTVQWRVANSLSFIFNLKNPESTIKSVSESAMREVIGRSKFAEAMTTNRSMIETDLEKLIQDILDLYESGIEIYAVNLNDVQNPAPVMPAFLDVETAKQDKQTKINEALAYQNEIIPRARGMAQKQIQEAEAYREQVISIASGEAQRFAEVLSEYSKAKDVTKKRIYIETMQDVLKGSDKMIIDKGVSQGVLPYLPLNEMKKR